MEMVNKEKALEKFMENNAAVLVKLEALKSYFENHMGVHPYDVDWGWVGNSGHVLEMLTEITEFLNTEEGK